MRSFSWPFVLPWLVLLLAGCGGPSVVPVKGTVTRHGQPVPYVFITFYPAEGRPSSGLADAQGHFELSYLGEQKGVLVGEHKVVLIFRPRNPQQEFDLAAGKIKLHPDQDAITAKYGNRETTPLLVQVTHANQEIELKLD